MGQAGSPVSEVYFKNCKVPGSCILGGKEGVGFKSAMKALNKQRIHLSALSTGPAMRMLDEATKHALERKQFGGPIADFQLVQAMIADSHTEIAAARALILETARERDEGGDVTLKASMCKYFATEMCGRVADRAVQIFGGSGYVADYSNIERFYRDVRLFRLYEGTSQIHQLNIAKNTKNKFLNTEPSASSSYMFCNPCLLQRMDCIFIQPFNCRDFGTGRIAYGCDTGPGCFSINMNRAGPTKTRTATKLCSRHLQMLTDHPKQWCVIWHIHIEIFAVYC